MGYKVKIKMDSKTQTLIISDDNKITPPANFQLDMGQAPSFINALQILTNSMKINNWASLELEEDND